MTTSPWTDERVAVEQRALVDRQLAEWHAGGSMPHFTALRDAVALTNCPGSIMELGCASGYSLEIIPEEYRQNFAGADISRKAICIAEERYPSGNWFVADATIGGTAATPSHDIVIDGSCLLHIDDWKAHLRSLCAMSRRWVILHRAPIAIDTHRTTTSGYGQTFPAWNFSAGDIEEEMMAAGFEHVKTLAADGGNSTMVFARPRHFVSYADRNYLSRLRALHGSLARHAGPFELHVLAWDAETWAEYSEMSRGKEFGAMIATDFLVRHPELRPENLPGPARSKVEHYWSCGPAWLADVIKATGQPATYIDADIKLFASPESVFAEIGGARAAVFPHDFASQADGLPGPTIESHRLFGLYNVGWVHVSDVRVAQDWAERCHRWCFDRIAVVDEANGDRVLRYADQSYLDEWPWPGKFGAHVVTNPAAALGPWSIHRHPLERRPDGIYYAGRRLISYHYSSLRLGPHGTDQLTRPEYHLTDEQAAILYPDYIQEIR